VGGKYLKTKERRQENARPQASRISGRAWVHNERQSQTRKSKPEKEVERNKRGDLKLRNTRWEKSPGNAQGVGTRHNYPFLGNSDSGPE